MLNFDNVKISGFFPIILEHFILWIPCIYLNYIKHLSGVVALGNVFIVYDDSAHALSTLSTSYQHTHITWVQQNVLCGHNSCR